jgi:hypothetical protein
VPGKTILQRRALAKYYWRHDVAESGFVTVVITCYFCIRPSRELPMHDELKRTMKIVRQSKVTTDERGRTVWDGTVETVSLELVSTQMLRQLIEAGDSDTQDQLRKVAQGADGVLAHDADKGRFEVISDEELQRILDGTDAKRTANSAASALDEPAVKAASDDPELDLVSTQMLRTILGPDDFEQSAESGFDPYDHS